MFVEFPDDPACRYLDRQYMLGSSLLVAPVFRQDSVAEYFLPEGKWTHLITGKVLEGGQWRSEKIGFLDLPLFVRANTVLPMSSNDQQPQWRLEDELSLRLFEIADGADMNLRLADSVGDGVSQINCRRQGSKITLTSDGRAKKMRVVSYGVTTEWSDIGKPFVLNQKD
jgi:alpha-D-xyloside xylohydrolase